MIEQGTIDFAETKKDTGPVECLGQTFESDDARREHYLKLLAAKLKDPEFRKTPGFPKGTDEDILRLSDPQPRTKRPAKIATLVSVNTRIILHRFVSRAFRPPLLQRPRPGPY